MLTTLASITFLLLSPFNAMNQRIKLIPSGENIVFKMNTNGVVITGSYDVKHDKGTYNPFKHSGLKKGDIIKRANKKNINNISDLSSIINSSSQISIEIQRQNETINTDLYIYKVNDICRSGLYVKDKVIGVGTMTYIDPKGLYYGSLGHEVIDNDTNELVNLADGEIYYNDVISISKGSNHHPGEKISKTNLDNITGDIIENSNKGIFGKYLGSSKNKKEYEIAKQNEIKKGKATILTCVKGNKVESYNIEIINLKEQGIDETKGITFKIIDKNLIDIAGGIYSGMSGSPIIQNNRIIGAVTHVLVDNVECGYGIYIENMYYHQLTSCN